MLCEKGYVLSGSGPVRGCVRRDTSCLAAWSIDRLRRGRSIDRPIDPSIDRSIDRGVDRSIHRSRGTGRTGTLTGSRTGRSGPGRTGTPTGSQRTQPPPCWNAALAALHFRAVSCHATLPGAGRNPDGRCVRTMRSLLSLYGYWVSQCSGRAHVQYRKGSPNLECTVVRSYISKAPSSTAYRESESYVSVVYRWGHPALSPQWN